MYNQLLHWPMKQDMNCEIKELKELRDIYIFCVSYRKSDLNEASDPSTFNNFHLHYNTLLIYHMHRVSKVKKKLLGRKAYSVILVPVTAATVLEK